MHSEICEGVSDFAPPPLLSPFPTTQYSFPYILFFFLAGGMGGGGAWTKDLNTKNEMLLISQKI